MQHCTRKDNHFIKDLNRLGRDDVRLLDKNPVSYFLQPSKGISVRKFLGDPQDVELLRLLNDLRPGLEIIDISFEAPQPAFSLSLDIPADQSLDVEAAPEGFDDDSSVEILVALFGNLRIDDGFDETVSTMSESEVDEAAKEVGHESDSFGAHHDPCCFVASVYHVHQEQVQQGDIKNLEPQEDIASKTTRPRRSRVSNCGPLRRSARLAQKYPRRSPRLAAKRLAAKP
jgi:hypothetical protein